MKGPATWLVTNDNLELSDHLGNDDFRRRGSGLRDRIRGTRRRTSEDDRLRPLPGLTTIPGSHYVRAM